MKMLHPLLSFVLLLGTATSSYAAELPLFDAHIHYNHDVWDSLPADNTKGSDPY